MQITPEWLAGFFDGEGCFTIGKARRTHFTPRATLTHTDRNLLEAIQIIYGGTLHSKGFRNIKWKPAYMLVWGGTGKVQSLLKCIGKYLVLKQPQAELLLNWAEAISDGRAGRHGVSETELLLRESFKEKIHDLNRRGNQK